MSDQPPPAADRVHGAAPSRSWTRAGLVPAAIAGLLACVALLLGWRGVDLPASVYRIDLFRRHGFTAWDSQWYGGHWNLSYSLLFPPLAGFLGFPLTEVASAATAAWAFSRLVVGHFGRRAAAGAVVFAVWTLAQIAVGQLPFLLGEALGLGAVLAASRSRWILAGVLAVACTLASPLCGGFLMIAAAAWLVTAGGRRRVGLAALLAAPGLTIAALFVAFPGQGAMPFSAAKCAWVELAIATACLAVARRERALRVGLAFYGLAVAIAFVVASPVGDNITRLAECLGVPLLVCCGWSRRRVLVLGLAVPLSLIQWVPAMGAIVNRGGPAVHRSYYRPLVSYLQAHAQPLGRVEIVPTRAHWEAAYVAPAVPLARGWERQLDTADNPIFYRDGPLAPEAYLTWLRTNGVRYVALPDAPLDYAGADEARLVRQGVRGLPLVWADAHWRVYRVSAAPGMVEGPARLTLSSGSHLTLDVTEPGTIVVRVRYSRRWSVARGAACLRRARGNWTLVTARRPGPVQLHLGLALHRPVPC